MIAAIFLLALGAYSLVGLAFAAAFVTVGVGRMDSHAAHGSWGFRLLIVPGSIVFWPLLLRRWIAGSRQPPEERNAHRQAAQSSRPHTGGGSQ
jgi:hypothetical protein